MQMAQIKESKNIRKKRNWKKIFSRDIKKNYELYIMIIPIVIYFIMFCYIPMYGAVIAFKSYSPSLGILESPWVGFKHFKNFFTGYYFTTLITNTLRLSLASLIFGFPMPIILALLINELRSEKFKRLVQTVSYLPHFISLVVVCGMITNFVDHDGVISSVMLLFGKEPKNLLYEENLFMPIYVISNIWQEVGWGSIIYFAAMAGIDPQMYEAADIDGVGKFRKMWSITLPSIAPTIVTLLILNVGKVMSVGYEKIILLYNGLNMGKADVISSYVYREGLQNFNWSYSSAVGLFNSVINFILLIAANKASRKLSDSSLW